MASEVERIGGPDNYWLYSKSDGFDLTHPQNPDAPPISPRISLKTVDSRVAIDPKKTALVIIDLQNYFLSPALGRPRHSPGLGVVDRLLKFAIPACRTADIPVVWLGWGLTQDDIDGMPPTVVRGFAQDDNFKGERKVAGLGSEVGPVELEDGSTIEGGRVLLRGQWNSAFYNPLAKEKRSYDLSVDKNRLSGFWGGTGIEDVLESRGIRTLIFAGGNTDQCVACSITDAVHKGYDCLLLSDGCSTTSPQFSQQCIEFNMGGWGFLLTCKEFADGVSDSQTQQEGAIGSSSEEHFEA